jgi:hypothetical protein
MHHQLCILSFFLQDQKLVKSEAALAWFAKPLVVATFLSIRAIGHLSVYGAAQLRNDGVRYPETETHFSPLNSIFWTSIDAFRYRRLR